MLSKDHDWMKEAIREAQKAFEQGEVPVGALAVSSTGEILARAHNQTLHHGDPCAHAEILVIKEAAQKLGNHRLKDVTIYVTLEPCSMCAGAMVQARIKRLVFATRDWAAGAAGTVINILNHPAFNHRVELDEGCFQKEAQHLLQVFFQQRRS